MATFSDAMQIDTLTCSPDSRLVTNLSEILRTSIPDLEAILAA